MKMFYLFILLLNTAIAGFPPTTIKGQQDAAKTTNFNLQLPHKQATKVSGAYLIETGNKNLLANPNFEHSTYDSGWTLSGGAGSVAETTIKFDLQGMVIVASSDVVSFKQETTENIASFAYGGVQGLGLLQINTTVQGLYFCPLLAGVSITSNHAFWCYTVVGDGTWELAKIHFFLGDTSNGVELLSVAAVSGNIYVDDAFMGAVDLKQDIPIDSDSYVRVDTANGYGSTNTMIRRFTNIIDNIGTDITYADSATLGGSFTINKSGLYSISFSDQFSGAQPLGISKSTVAPTTSIISIAVGERLAVQSTNAANVAGNAAWEGYLAVGDIIRAHTSSQASGTTPALSSFTIAKRGGGTSSVYTTPSDSFSTDENVFAHKTTAIVAADPIGTYTTYSYTINSNTQTICATPPTTVPTSANGVLIYTRAYNAASTCNLPAKYEIKIGTGMLARSVDIFKSAAKTTLGATDFVWAGNASSGIGVQGYDAVSGMLVIDAGYNWSALTTNALFSFNNNTTQTSGYLVINAQKKKDFILGNFNGIETCANSYECTDTYSASVTDTGASAPVTAGSENLDWINGDCTNPSAGTYTCTFKTGVFTAAPNCEATHADLRIPRTSTTSTAVTIYAYSTGAALSDSNGFTVSCQRAAADYIGKTAKAVASDQNDRSPGIVGAIETSAVVDCDAGSLSSASQDGTPWISSSTNIAGGACTLTLVSGTFSATPKCLINWSDTGGAGGTGKIVYNTATSATSITVDCEDDASTNCTSYDYTIFCKGSRP